MSLQNLYSNFFLELAIELDLQTVHFSRVYVPYTALVQHYIFGFPVRKTLIVSQLVSTPDSRPYTLVLVRYIIM